PTDSAASDAMQHDFANPYRAVYVLTKSIVGAKNVFSVDAKTLYELREAYIENMWDEYYLTEGEKEYWRDKKAEVETPLTYEYTYGSTKTIVEVYTCSALMLLFVAVALAAVFSDEYNKGMDKLIMSTRYGKARTYFAKISAGVVFAFVGAMLIVLSGAVPTLLIYGAEGMDAAIQLYMEVSPFPMTVGEVLIAFFLIYIVAAFLYAALTMFFSQVFKNSITSMGIMVAFMLVEMCLSVPAHLRVLAQIFDLLPSNVLAIWSLYDCKLVPWFGGYLTNLQFAPIAYAALTVVLVLIGKFIQRRREAV
ncbi:MAG: ABC transporter permease, partial [Lachnospiraceae bacterium]|nr:ABC transporter permease [Lachnospiraceae bacterium]